MIYKEIIEQNFNRIYNEIASNSLILFGSDVVEESVKVKNPSRNLELIIRTQSDGGHAGNNIIHGAALKLKIENKKFTDLFVVKQKDGTYKCVIDRKEKNSDKISTMVKYKVARKFIEKNAETIVKIYNSTEGSKNWNRYINELKESNPEFKYSK